MHQRNNLEQVSGWSISTTRQEKQVSQERLEKLWWAPAVATSPGVHSGSQLTHAGSCEAREMLGLGTQAPKPWGLKHQANRQRCPPSVSFLKADYRSGGPGKMTISSPSVWTRPFFVSQSPETQAGDAPRSGGAVSCTKVVHFRKLCVLASKEEDLDRLDQSAYILIY